MNITACGLSRQTTKALAAKKIETSDDYMKRLPCQYRDFSNYSHLDKKVNTEALIHGTVEKVSRHQKDRTSYIKADIVEYETNTRFSVMWFNQDYLYTKLVSYEGEEVAVGGTITKHFSYGYQIVSPEFFYYFDEMPCGIYPKYRKIKGVSEEMQRGLYGTLNQYTAEHLEAPVLDHFMLRDLRNLYASIHFPQTMEEGIAAMDEYHLRELAYFATKMKLTYPKQGKGYTFKKTDAADAFISALPFALTEGQQTAADIIKTKTSTSARLRMLVQGDVGCGKTVVAIYAAMLAISNGYQAVIAAPTSVLAGQHYAEVCRDLEMVNTSLGTNYKAMFVNGGMKASEERAAISAIAAGEADIIVGTHSTFSQKYQYKNLGLAVIDEEHRFGVEQRDALKEKAGDNVHLISMSATPIPRSLATILYGDNCEIVPIKSMPAGRTPVQSAICSSDRSIFSFIQKQLESGRQAYVVCSLVEDGDDNEKKSVTDAYKRYEAYFGKKYPVSFAHGKMKKQELEAELEKFRSGETKILISTTVVEVGVNVPNANVIVIENAEQFGLATLHQLRGRVGRGQWQSYCIFKSTQKDNERLNLLVNTTDGFVIAEKDMEMRGTGSLIGLKQTGYNRYIMLIMSNPDLYRKACEMADWLISNHYLNIISEPESENIFDDLATARS